MTVRDRLPTILTKVIDTIHRNKNKFLEEHGEVRIVIGKLNSSLLLFQNYLKTPGMCFLILLIQKGIEAEKQTIALLSKMRNELQTDKPILALTDGLQDTESWNQYLLEHQRLQGDKESVSWFKSPWLYVECYMYRRIQEALWLK